MFTPGVQICNPRLIPCTAPRRADLGLYLGNAFYRCASLLFCGRYPLNVVLVTSRARSLEVGAFLNSKCQQNSISSRLIIEIAFGLGNMGMYLTKPYDASESYGLVESASRSQGLSVLRRGAERHGTGRFSPPLHQSPSYMFPIWIEVSWPSCGPISVDIGHAHGDIERFDTSKRDSPAVPHVYLSCPSAISVSKKTPAFFPLLFLLRELD